MADFTIVVDQACDGVEIAVTGELNESTSFRLREALLGLEAEGVCRITIDLSGIEFVDSTALGVLVGGVKRLRRREGDLVLRAPPSATLKAFKVAGLSDLFTISPDGRDV
ncbi:MAG TPA: STAS domain-containing protein [Acidimicrobiales bacterium]|jgi:anti-sigma B factor antagonist|nr:STAS domain-containing protein [Acidimicrobiales bacterium]